MEIHDAVMPEMGTIMKIRKQVLLKVDSTQDNTTNDEFVKMSETLDEAYDSMMGWMRDFDPNFEGTPEEYNSYLKDQKEKMIVVRDQMLSSIEDGKKMIETY